MTLHSFEFVLFLYKYGINTMSESTAFGNEKEIINNDNMKQNSTKKTTNQLSLRERVFQVCKQFEDENKEITWQAVRQKTKGSQRNVSKYIQEWNDNKNRSSLAVQNSSSTEVKISKKMLQATEETVQAVLNNYEQQHSIDVDQAIKRGAERYIAMRAGEEAIVQFFFDHPDQLPEPYKQQLEEITNASDEKINARSARYEVDFFTQMVLESIR
jgi:Plasmid replication region DNA-binding N-term